MRTTLDIDDDAQGVGQRPITPSNTKSVRAKSSPIVSSGKLLTQRLPDRAGLTRVQPFGQQRRQTFGCNP